MNLETERLLLRKLRESDLDDFHTFRSDPEICKFQSFKPFTIEESRQFIADQSKTRFGSRGKWVQTGIVSKELKKLVGDFALKPEEDEPRTVEIGITLASRYQGKGFAGEALRTVFEYLFTETDTHRIIALLDPENHGSRKLMENLGMRREAEFRKSYWDEKMNEWRDEYVYAMLREDWELSDTF